MYLTAKIIEDTSNGGNGQHYMGWITRLHRQILEHSTSINVASADPDAHLAGLHDVRDVYSYLEFAISSLYSLLACSLGVSYLGHFSGLFNV
jgi:hypothetical protein